VRGVHARPGPVRKEGEVPVYREIFVRSILHTFDWAVERSIELSRKSDGRINGKHVYAAASTMSASASS